MRLASPHVAAALLGYTALAVVLTWPLTARLGSAVPLGDNDLWQNYWNAWWWQRCLEAGEWPFRTDLLFHPTGASLVWHTHSPANVIGALPAAWIAERVGLDGPAAAIGVATLAGFILAALGAHLLARELLDEPAAAPLAGIVFGFFPHHVEQSLEHLNLASYWAMPFALLYLARAAHGEGPRAWAPAGFFLALNALLSWHNAALLFFMGIAVAIYELRWAPYRGLALTGLALAGLLAMLLVLPFLWPMLLEATEKGGSFKEPVHKPIDPLFLFVPHPGHPLWGDLVAPLYARFRPYPSAGFVAYVGVGVVALCAAAFGGARGDGRGPELPAGEKRGLASPAFIFWAALALGHLILALGRKLQVGGHDIPLWLPFAALEHVPLLNTVRVANRFVVPAMLAVAMLAALGGGAVASHFRERRHARQAVWIVGALVVLEYLWLPYPMREIPRPAYLEALEKLPPGLAVLDIPTGAGPRAAEDMLHQTRHGRPIVGGYLSRTPPGILRTLQEHPVLEQFFYAHPPPPPRGESLPEVIRALRVGIVVVHLDRERGRIEERREEARRKDPAELYVHRLYNPEKGIPAVDLDRIRANLRESFGPPVFADLDSEIYLTGGR